jgi:hypothetical protein
MKACKIKRREGVQPKIYINYLDPPAQLPKPKLPCAFITNVHGSQLAIDRAVLLRLPVLEVGQVAVSVVHFQQPDAVGYCLLDPTHFSGLPSPSGLESSQCVPEVAPPAD